MTARFLPVRKSRKRGGIGGTKGDDEDDGDVQEGARSRACNKVEVRDDSEMLEGALWRGGKWTDGVFTCVVV